MAAVLRSGRRISESRRFPPATMKVTAVDALSDNYMYLLEDTTNRVSAIVDPVSLDNIKDVVSASESQLTCALVTHHHWDHAGATRELSDEYRGITIYGGDERISRMNQKVHDGQTFEIGNLKVKCLSTPCHTSGSICYYVTDNDEKAVFTGDTLFIGGCGRFFEGTAEQMDRALNDVLASLPDDTKVYCGHEYTVDNLKFALSVEPDNDYVERKLKWAKEQRAAHKRTVPSTIGEEKTYNPFMRVRTSETLQKSAGSTNPVNVMGRIRERKNAFRT